MDNLNQKIKTLIKDIDSFFKESLHKKNFSIIDLELCSEVNNSRRDLLTLAPLVNLFEIHSESDKITSDSFYDSILGKIGLFSNLVDNFPGIIMIMDLKGQCKFVNKFTKDNLKGKEWIGKKVSNFFTTEQYEKFIEKKKTIEKEGYFREINYFVDNKDKIRNFEKFYFLLEGKKENVIVLLGVDVTDKIVMERKLNDLAYKDSLTDIYNYNYFLMKTESLVNKEERFSLIYIDIKKFRVINEIYGYEAGDRMLFQVAKLINLYILKLGQSEDIILTRFKDDEFIIIHQGKSKEEAVEFSKNLMKILKKPIIINDIVHRLELDIGISSYPEDGSSKETLIRKAALAKIKAKLNGEVNLVSFSVDLEAEIKKEYELETEIYESLERGEFELYLQPILDLNTEKIIKAEALIRWNHKEHGLITPIEFIPTAEKSNLILKIGEWVLDEACKIQKRWEYKDINIPISINISGKQLLQYNFPEIVKDKLAKYEIEAEKIMMEVTENYIFEEGEHLQEVIKKLNKIGIRFSMDDFGTGSSSMTKLKHVNFAEIKIDRSFIGGLLENKTDEYLVKNIIALAKDLEIDVVAEGVENLKQYNFLNQLGCKYVQGFLFSKPIKLGDFEKFFAQKIEIKKTGIEEFIDEVEKFYNLPLPIIILDKNFHIKGFNSKFQEYFKWEKKDIFGKNFNSLTTPRVAKEFKDFVKNDINFILDFKLPIIKKDSNFLDTIIKVDQGAFADSLKGDIVIIITQVTNKEMIENLGYLEFLDNVPNSIMVTDIDGNIEYVNKKFTNMSGYQAEEVLGKNPSFLSSGLIPNEVFRNLWETILQGKEWQGELHNKKKNQETYWQGVKINPIFNNREIEKFIATIEDITQKKAYEKRLRYLAKIDPMTGAMTRAAGMEFLEIFFEDGIMTKEDISLIFLDLDNLKDINDRYGHIQGDEAIKIVAEIIQKNIRKDHVFIRYGGDEFLIVLREKGDKSPASIINRIKIDLEIISRRLDAPITLSFGIANSGEEINDNLEKMIKRADARMYLEKSRKKQE